MMIPSFPRGPVRRPDPDSECHNTLSGSWIVGEKRRFGQRQVPLLFVRFRVVQAKLQPLASSRDPVQREIFLTCFCSRLIGMIESFSR
jgi:hypothetical protein